MVETVQKRRLKRPVVSDQDGTREGGLVFCIALFGGVILTGAVNGQALASFWVWFALLAMAVGLAWNVQQVIARMNGVSDEDTSMFAPDTSGDERL